MQRINQSTDQAGKGSMDDKSMIVQWSEYVLHNEDLSERT